MKIKLKPCQCGGEARFFSLDGKAIQVVCTLCKLSTAFYRGGLDIKTGIKPSAKKQAAEAWNRRVDKRDDDMEPIAMMGWRTDEARD